MTMALRQWRQRSGPPDNGREYSEFLAAIIDSSDDAIYGSDLQGTIKSWNLGAQMLYGYAASEVIGRHVSFLVPPDRLDEPTDILDLIKRGERVEHHDTRRTCKDGSTLDVSVSVSAIRDNRGQIIGASAIARSIKERLALEKEHELLMTRIHQSERLESLGQLAGGIAHDFNNLLAVILNYSTFVSEEIENKDAALADLNQIRTAAERAVVLTRHLLAFARREVQQAKIIDINEMITNIFDLLDGAVGDVIEIMVDLAPDLWLIKADPGQLEQILVHLSMNARDAMSTVGTLTIDTENIEIDETYSTAHAHLSPGRYVRLRVSDDGSGMEREVLERAFEPFFTTKPSPEATGLGLSTVFGIVSQAGGDIELYSELGIGTTCRVLLPAVDTSIVSTRPKLDITALGGNEIILVIDDEVALRDVTQRMLERNGYNVLSCADGTEALALAERQEVEIDLLLTDVIMPNMNGSEVARHVRTLRPNIPVLFMSGYAQPVLGSTLDDDVLLLEKPYTQHSLLTKVREALDTREPRK